MSILTNLFSGGAQGASGTGTGSLANVYTPTAQPAADQMYQNIVQNLNAQGYGPAGQNYPTGQGFVDRYMTGSPYMYQAQAGANTVADYAGQFFPYQAGSGYSLQGAGNTAMTYGNLALQQGYNPLYQTLLDQTQNNPYYQGALSGANQAANIGGQWASNLQNPLRAGVSAAAPLLANAQGAIDYGKSVYGAAAPIQSAAQDIYGKSGQLWNAGQDIFGQSNQLWNAGQDIYGRSGQLWNAGQDIYGRSGQLWNAGQDIYGQAAPIMDFARSVAGKSGDVWNAAQNVANTAFDPQSALFNRMQGQTLDQQNAINAMSGVAGSPYGAGITGDAMRNLNIDWQNQQLARQQAGLGALGQGLTAQQAGLGALGTGYNVLNQGLGALGQGLQGNIQGMGALSSGLQGNIQGMGALSSGLQGRIQGMGALSSGLQGNAQGMNALSTGQQALGYGADAYNRGLNAYSGALGGYNSALTSALQGGAGTANLAAQSAALPGQTYTNQLNNILSALQAQQKAGVTGSSAFDNLLRSGAAGYQAGAGLQNNALQQYLAGTQAPYNTGIGFANNALTGLQSANNLAQQQYALPESVLNAIAAYMKLGQGASATSADIGQLGFNQTAQGLEGLTRMAGSFLPMVGSMLPFIF